jgi:hypothetical protein
MEGEQMRKITMAALGVLAALALASSAHAGTVKAHAASDPLTVGWGCDQYAVLVDVSNPVIAAGLNAHGGFGYVGSRFYLRRAPTWLSCSLTLIAKDNVHACDVTTEVAGEDYDPSGYAITYARCY